MGTKIDALQYSMADTFDGMVKNKVQEVEKDFSSYMEVVASSYSNAENAGSSVEVATSDENQAVGAVEETRQETSVKDVTSEKTTVEDAEESTMEEPFEKICKELGMTEDEVVEKLELLDEQMLVMIADVLGVSVEQLTQTLDTLGMTPVDLVQMSNLTEVMVSLGVVEDAGEVLTDANLFQQMKALCEEVNAAINEFADEYSVSAEEATEVLRQYSDVIENAQPEQNSESTDVQNVVIEVQDNRNADNAMSDMANNQFAAGNQAVQQFTNQVVNAAVNAELAYVADMEQIVNQVVEQMKLNLNSDSTSIEMQLNPESYGKVQLHVIVRDGVVTAQMAVENEAVRSALESQVVTLKENMNNQGVKVEAIEVTIASHEFERNLQQDSNASQDAYEQEQAKATNRRVSLNLDDWQDEDLENMTEAEVLERRMMLESGNRISYQI